MKKYLVSSILVLLVSYTLQEETESKKTAKNAEIIIIGAGIAGLTIADKLLNDYGFQNVRIIEGMNRIGGRVNPIPYKDGYLQEGAEFIHGSGNPVYKLALKLGILPTPAEEEKIDNMDASLFLTMNGCQVYQDLLLEFWDYYGPATDKLDSLTEEYNNYDKSVGQIYEDAFNKFLNKKIANNVFNSSQADQFRKLLEIFKGNQESDNGVCNWNNLSFRQWVNYEEKPEEHAFVINRNGYDAVLKHLKPRISKAIIHLNKIVTQIDWSRNSTHSPKVLVDNEWISGDHVIVTSSIGHLQANLDKLFKQSLPKRKADAIRNRGYGCNEKFFIELDAPFWSSDTESIGFVHSNQGTYNCRQDSPANALPDDHLARIFNSFSVHPWFPNVLMAFINGENNVQRFIAATDEELTDAADTLLKRYYSPTVRKPKILLRSRWRENPLTLGAYSYYDTKDDNTKTWPHDIAEPLLNERDVPVLMFAGEGTMDHQFQTVHGAMLSGMREAKRLNRLYNSGWFSRKRRARRKFCRKQRKRNNRRKYKKWTK